MKLYDITAEFQKLEDVLATGEVTEETEELLAELMTAEGEKLDGYLMIMANFKMLQDGADAESKRLKAKATSAKNSIDRMKKYLALHFIATGTKDITRPLGKFVLKTAGKARFVLDVESIDLLPKKYTQVMMLRTINEDKLKEDLESKAGKKRAEALEFAHFEPKKQYIQIY